MTLALPSVKSYFGIAKETTKGIPEPATQFVAFAQNSFKPVDNIGPLYDTGIRGSMVENYAYLQGRRHTTIDVGGLAFADTIGFFIAGILGDVTTTGASAPYTHSISLLNSPGYVSDAQPTSFTITDFYAADTRYYPGCQITDFGLTFNADGLLEYTAKLMGFPSENTSPTTPNFSNVLPTQVWTGTVSVGGSPIGYTKSASLELARKSEPIFSITGNKKPYQIFLGALTARGKMTFVMQNDNELINYLSDLQPSLTFNFTTGTGAGLTQIAYTLSSEAYTLAAIERSADHVELTVDFEGLGNGADVGTSGGYSPIKFTLQNAYGANTYQ